MSTAGNAWAPGAPLRVLSPGRTLGLSYFSPQSAFWAEGVLTAALGRLSEGAFTAWLELRGQGGQGKAVNKDRLVVYFVFFKINTLYIKEKGL